MGESSKKKESTYPSVIVLIPSSWLTQSGFRDHVRVACGTFFVGGFYTGRVNIAGAAALVVVVVSIYLVGREREREMEWTYAGGVGTVTLGADWAFADDFAIGVAANVVLVMGWILVEVGVVDGRGGG